VINGAAGDAGIGGFPGAVVRAFDATTGRLVWAWDMGRPDRHSEPPQGETYTRNIPGSWATLAGDADLGLVYVPTENSSPNQFGGHRNAADEKYSVSIVALEAASGKVRWSFQTVHHDIWDYDLPSQPSLVDYKTTEGKSVRALVQSTKQGEVYVLDRTTGRPLHEVREFPAPQNGTVPEERLSPTQPYSVGMPSFRGAKLVEGDMWGITPLDQLWCRIKFREYRYDGIYTPLGLTPAIQYPGWYGATNWGGVSVDTDRKVVLINSISFAYWTRLVPKQVTINQGRGLVPKESKEMFEPDYRNVLADSGPVRPHFVTPVLGVPCISPPYGRLSAVDLPTGKLLWTRKFGSARETGPMGIRSRVPFTLGTLSAGGCVSTRTGLFFIGASADRAFRAYETTTGKLLWQTRLPESGMATPMTFISKASRRQFVVIVAGPNNTIAPASDGGYIIAYALPAP